ncbi:MAG: hypothetical protein LBQ56_07490 [Synergistaceae bacterium]|nr:hypothetical protein [Synergistaceae bacterium]
MGNADESSIRLLQVLCGQPVTLLDPVLCDGRANLRWLFQSVASTDCLNLVLTNLGGRWSEDSAFRIPKECSLLVDYLECELVPVVYSDMSSTITVRTITEVLRQFENLGRDCIHSIMFRSILNYREYELVDREVGRKTSAISLGSIPKSMERDLPLLSDLCSAGAKHAVFPLLSASRQLKGVDQMVSWGLFNAIAKADPEWKLQPRLCDQITDAGKVNIAVVRHPALMLGGDGTEHLMRTLGCNVVEVPLEGAISHSVPIHGVYIPHGMSFLVSQNFFKNLYLKTMLTRGGSGSSFLLAEGGSAPLLGDRISLPPGYGQEEERGFNLLPYDSAFKAMTMGAPHKAVAVSRKQNPLLVGSQENLSGYMSSNLSIVASDPNDDCWTLKEGPQGREIGTDAWCRGRVLATRMRIEPWSVPASFLRWLEG